VAYHLAGPDRVRLGVLTGYLRAAGYRLREYPVDQWAAMIRDQPGNAAGPGLEVFPGEMPQVQLGTAATMGALGGPACPDLTPDLFATYLRYFTQTGYLPPPA
jgi:hypothetical protein